MPGNHAVRLPLLRPDDISIRVKAVVRSINCRASTVTRWDLIRSNLPVYLPQRTLNEKSVEDTAEVRSEEKQRSRGELYSMLVLKYCLHLESLKNTKAQKGILFFWYCGKHRKVPPPLMYFYAIPGGSFCPRKIWNIYGCVRKFCMLLNAGNHLYNKEIYLLD